MVNGKLGDDPVTDIVKYGVEIFSPEADALVAEIDGLGGWESLFARMALVEWQEDLRGMREAGRDTAGPLVNLMRMLQTERDRLQRAAST
jgi:hypothetical protein